MSNNKQGEPSKKNNSSKYSNNRQGNTPSNSSNFPPQAMVQEDTSQENSLTKEEQQKSKIIEEDIQQFEQTMEEKSNSELADIATQLDTVERSMLLKKIDNELHTIKDTIIKSGDGTESTLQAGTDAAVAAVAVTQNSSS